MKSNFSFNDVNDALFNASKAGILELVKLMPGTGVFIESYKGYKDKLKEISLEKFLKKLSEEISYNKELFNDNFYKTVEGRIFSIRILDIATECQYMEKIDFFINALINIKNDFSSDEKIKFIDLIKNISLPSLKIFAHIISVNKQMNKKSVDAHIIADNLKMEPFFVNSCLSELKSQGIISDDLGGDESDNPDSIMLGGYIITEFSNSFFEFIMSNKNNTYL